MLDTRDGHDNFDDMGVSLCNNGQRPGMAVVKHEMMGRGEHALTYSLTPEKFHLGVYKVTFADLFVK